MNNPEKSSTFLLPYKSVGVALIFCVLLGPIGLLYASFWGGFVMILLGIIVISSQFFFPIILLWIICCIWGVKGVEAYNQKIFKISIETNKR